MSSRVAFVAAKNRVHLSYSMLSYYLTVKSKTYKLLFFFSHAEYPSLMALKKKPSSFLNLKTSNYARTK